MEVENIPAFLLLLIYICLPIFCIGAVLALVSMDRYLQKMEKHLEQLTRSVVKYTYENTESKNNNNVNNMTNGSMPVAAMIPQVQQPWRCEYCSTMNNGDEIFCSKCSKQRSNL